MISNSQKIFLRSLLHHQGVVIWIGQKGLTECVSKEIESALTHHEALKLKIRSGDREIRDKIADQICHEHQAQLIQKTGNVVSIFRQNPENPQIKLPG